MSLYYSASTGGFYDSVIHGDNMPEDVTEESAWSLTHQELLEGQSSGKKISSDESGNPILSDQPEPTDEQLAASVRAKRDQLIAETDYLVMPDYPISTDLLAKVKVYRQALRDITIQVGFPYDIDWPINTLDEVGV